jgi:catechol 2,3-dioxygenase-like lactoylglutathione lyase family enzyme
MPDTDDLARWRADAKALRAAVVDGDEAALARVLTSHPKYAGRPRERLEKYRPRFSLRDAQWTIAREHGHDSWTSLCDQGRRWPPRTMGPQQGRAARIASDRGDGHCGVEHLLLALATPPRPTIAGAVLESVGADLEKLRARPPIPTPEGRKGISINPRGTACIQAAVAFAITQGAERVADEHILLALAYTEPDVLFAVDIDPDEIYDALAERQVPVPPLRPSTNAPPRGPYNASLVVRRADLNAVLAMLRTRHPPGTEHWGFNYSKDLPDEAYVISEDEIDIEAIAREALGDEGSYRLVPMEEIADLTRRATTEISEPTPKPNHIGLTVTDLDESMAFYRDVAGMELERRYPVASDEWFKTLTENPDAVVEAVMLRRGLLRLQLVRYHAGGETGSTGHAARGGLHLCFEVADVDDAHRQLSAEGRYHVGPIVRREPYGGRSFYVLDPDGVPVELEQRDA